MTEALTILLLSLSVLVLMVAAYVPKMVETDRLWKTQEEDVDEASSAEGKSDN